MVTDIVFTYDKNNNITGIQEIIVANPLQQTSHINTKPSYLPSEIYRWDIYKVTENKK
jgi:hypothetical protein